METRLDDRLLTCDEEEFDKIVSNLEIGDVINIISLLQGEMEKEQNHFDVLSKHLESVDEDDSEHEKVSNELIESQTRLAMLASRNMKCFSQQIANENQDLANDITYENGVLHEESVKPVIEESSQPEKGDSDKDSPPVQTTVLETHTSHTSSVVTTHRSDNQKESPPKEGSFKMRSSYDREERGGTGNGQASRLKESVNTNTSFTVRSTVAPSQSSNTANQQHDEPAESINFAAARSMFESGGKATKRNPTNSAKFNITRKSNDSATWQSAAPVREPLTSISDNVSSSTSTSPKSSTATVVLTVNSQHGQGSSQKGFDGGRPAANRSSESADEPDTNDGGDKFSKSKVLQSKTWHQTVRDMGNQSCTRTPKQELEPPTPEVSREEPSPVRGQYTPSPVREPEVPATSTQGVKPEYNIAPVTAPAKLSPQETDTQSRSSTIKSSSSSISQHQRIHSQEEVIHQSPISHNSYSSLNNQTPESIKVNGYPATITGQSALSKPVNYNIGEEEGFTSDDKVKDRVTLKNWDPIKLLQDVYRVKLQPNVAEASKYINMEGYMEKLPQNKTKATLLKTWKRRYFKAKDGVLYYYESKSSVTDEDTAKEEEINFHNAGLDHATGHFQLMGGSIEDLGNKMLGIDDGRGRYLITRCPTDSEFIKWKRSLDTQTVGNITETYIQPALRSPPHSKKNVVVIDIGSCSVRAGILGEQASLPEVFFPTVVATNKETGIQSLGFDAFKPDVRSNSTFLFPIRPTANVDKFTVNMDLMPAIFGKVFKDLNINPKSYLIMLSAPASLNDMMKGQFMEILVSRFGVGGVNIVNQTLLSLYSYSASSGIVVDIGERLEIVPVTDGYIVEGGVTRQPYGGHKIADCLNATLAESKYHFFTHVDFTIVRRVMEEVCYVSQQFDKDKLKWEADANSVRKVVNLEKYDIPDGFLEDVCSDIGRFRAPEGLFNLSVWGMDNPPLHKLIQKAVQACPMDTRREMWRSIYLSGGVTQLPGFTERLQSELIKIVPGSIVVQVHASPQRYHAAYIGACTLAGIAEFERSCITAQEWKQKGIVSLQKWQLY